MQQQILVDLQGAIADHKRWAARLRQYGLGDRSVALDAETVCMTDQCALSRWLRAYRLVATRYAQDLDRLEQEHAQFHAKAAVVVAMMQAGATESALQSVQHGDFAQISQQLMQHLQALHDALAAFSSP